MGSRFSCTSVPPKAKHCDMSPLDGPSDRFDSEVTRMKVRRRLLAEAQAQNPPKSVVSAASEVMPLAKACSAAVLSQKHRTCKCKCLDTTNKARIYAKASSQKI